MSEKRFEKSKSDITDYRIYDYEKEDAYFIDCDDESTVDAIVDLLNEQQATIDKQNELIKLIAKACTYSKEHSVKEILRKEIKGIDTVTYESAGAWHDYVILSEFFKEHYKEHWDNE